MMHESLRRPCRQWGFDQRFHCEVLKLCIMPVTYSCSLTDNGDLVTGYRSYQALQDSQRSLIGGGDLVNVFTVKC